VQAIPRRTRRIGWLRAYRLAHRETVLLPPARSAAPREFRERSKKCLRTVLERTASRGRAVAASLRGMDNMLVVGAGTMGRGIAHVAALAGYEVHLADRKGVDVAPALAAVAADMQKGVERGKLAPEAAQAALARLRASTDLCAEAARADVVVEAVFEDPALKAKVLAHLDEHMRADALLGSNTSSLSLTQLAAATKHPGRVVGTHFFNPVHVMQLLEVVAAEQTTPETLERARQLATRLGKTAIVVKDTPGFATSRLGVCLGLEAIRMLEQGVASARDIDTAMELGYRHPMGPLALTDLVGLDVRLAIAEHLHRELSGEQYRPPELLRTLVAEGRTGKKAGHGFYRWVDGKPVPA
jgi:3-hydroxybutyryl-CoA dehydrogenase